ncbi:MAG TPA: ATP-binding protein, partial [Pseudomonadales bacterium]|nr:ATP-binding protein [Pseudomonadales bacterium]
MFLKRFVYVNWGNIPNNEFELGPINLFSGGNGSGKTTAADAIQTVMTAAHETLFQYNPGQDETTQRGRGGKRVRTLASYVLGCDDGSYARLDPTDGYLAAIFHPTEGETAEPFTAVVGVRAWLDNSGTTPVARQDDSAFWIMPGVELTLEHFQRPSTVGPYVVPLDKLPNLLIAEFGNKALEKYDTKKAYLRRLYGALRGREDSVSEREAVAAARAFSRFMAYKPVSSINQFVAEEILERKELGEAIRSVSGQLKTIHGMEREASSLIESITLLEHAGLQAQLAVENWLALTVSEYTIARNEHWIGQSAYLGEKEKQEALRRALTENEQAIELAAQRVEQVHDQLVSVEAQRQGVDELRRKDELEKKRSEAAQQLVKLGPQLLEHDKVLQTNLNHARTLLDAFQTGIIAAELPDVATSAQKHLVQEALEKGHRADLNVQTLLQQDLTGDLSPLEANLDHANIAQHAHNALRESWHAREPGQESKRDRLARVREDRQRKLESVLTQQRAKQAEISRLEAKQVNYPSYVENALALIRARCPQADPRVLCDHVEVKDARWQAAIEGYLGGARFGILVNPEYEAEAIKLVRSMPGRDVKARVIQGTKAKEDADRLAKVEDSIVEVLSFTHAVAKTYLLASYGNVVRVENAEALRHTRR